MLAFAEWLQGTGLSATIQTVGWVIPTLQSIHILMIGVVFISILIAALRILGRVHMEETLEAVWSRYSVWFWSALAVMALTGILLTIGEPVRQFNTLSFWLKMILLALALASAIGFGRVLVPASLSLQPGTRAEGPARIGAIATLALWLAIIFLGRAIAYDFEVWGSLSPTVSV